MKIPGITYVVGPGKSLDAAGTNKEVKVAAGPGIDVSNGYFSNPIEIKTVCWCCHQVHYSHSDPEALLCFRRYMFDRMSKDVHFKAQVKLLVTKKLSSDPHAKILKEASLRMSEQLEENEWR